MRLRKALIYGVVATALIVGIAGPSAFIANHAMTEALRVNVAAERVLAAVMEGAILTAGYIRKPNARAETQWEERHASLAALLERLALGPETDNLRALHADTGKLFSRLKDAQRQKAAAANPPAHLDNYIDNLVSRLSVAFHQKANLARRQMHGTARRMEASTEIAGWLIAGLVMALLTSMSAILLFAAKRIVAPVQVLRQGILEIGGGRLDYRFDMRRDDEIGDIAKELNAMAGNLKRITASRDELEVQIAKREAAENEVRKLNATLESRVEKRTRELADANRQLDALQRRWELILEAAGEGIYGLDLNGHTTFANKAAELLIGYTKEEMLDKAQHDLIHHTHADGKPYPKKECPIYASFTDGTVHSVDNEVFWRKDGEPFPVEYVSSPVRGADGELEGAVVIFRDVTERKRHEEELRRTNDELTATNQELEAFSYSVSHDLRAPLRTIDGFSDALLDDYKDILDEDGKAYLIRIRMAANRMATLIDDLLSLSRLTRQQMKLSPVDLSALALGVVAELREAEPDRAVKVEIAKGCKVFGDRTLLQVILHNLIGNAWKFSSGKPDARIAFGEEKTETIGRKAFFVKDNGAGFDPAFADKLFAPFQRLHRRDEFEGTGIGLATVQRAVHRHGGRVWAESAIGAGATFYFEI